MDHQAAAELLNEALEDRGIEISAGELLLIMENLDESLGMLEEHRYGEYKYELRCRYLEIEKRVAAYPGFGCDKERLVDFLMGLDEQHWDPVLKALDDELVVHAFVAGVDLVLPRRLIRIDLGAGYTVDPATTDWTPET